MTIKSSFFPNQALQGQDIPSHITWENLTYDSIIITKFDELQLYEIYNVGDSDYSIDDNKIIIDRVASDGYLGVVFSTKSLKEKSIDRTVCFKFIYKDKIIEEISRNIHLFRPDVVIIDVPEKIYVDLKEGKIKSKIHIKNYGEGTAIIDVITKNNSEIIKHEPEWVRNFNIEYVKSIEYGIDELKNNYNHYDDVLEELKYFLIHTISFNEDDLNKLRLFVNDLILILRSDEEFRYALSRMLIGVMLENAEYASMYQFISEYINSIIEEKMLLKDPFNVINVSKEEKSLSISIKCIDLLYQLCIEQDINGIKIISNTEGEIPLYKLFKWGDNE